jgi:hypothetical protein
MLNHREQKLKRGTGKIVALTPQFTRLFQLNILCIGLLLLKDSLSSHVSENVKI